MQRSIPRRPLTFNAGPANAATRLFNRFAGRCWWSSSPPSSSERARRPPTPQPTASAVGGASAVPQPTLPPAECGG